MRMEKPRRPMHTLTRSEIVPVSEICHPVIPKINYSRHLPMKGKENFYSKEIAGSIFVGEGSIF